MKDDCLKVLNFLGGKLYQYKYIKKLLVVEVVYYSLVLTCSAMDFLTEPTLLRFIPFAEFFFQGCSTVYLLSAVIILNHFADNIMSCIQLWEIDAVGVEIQTKILKQSRNISYFVGMKATFAFLASVLRFFEEQELLFLKKYLQVWCPGQMRMLFFLCKVLLIGTMVPSLTIVTAVIYVTQHLRFQMFMFNKITEDMEKDFDNKYWFEISQNTRVQEVIEFVLKSQIMRHQDFINWKTSFLKAINNLFLPCITGVVFMFISYVFSIFNISESTTFLTICRIITYATAGMLATVSIITSCQKFQDESEEIFSTFVKTKWYTWNIRNQKLFLNVLMHSITPLHLKFSEKLNINYELGLAICKMVYSAVSLFGDRLTSI